MDYANKMTILRGDENMSIRNQNYIWTEDAKEFAEEVRKSLKPIFDKYKNQFTFEEMYYLICTEFNDLIIDEVLCLRRPNSEYGNHIKE